MQSFSVSTRSRTQFVNITQEVISAVSAAGLKDGVVTVFVPHTTAGITINENADPDVPRDLLAKLEDLIPRREPFYRHGEGNSDSHWKTAAFGPSLTVLIHEGDLVLGTWQGVFFCEFDGPRPNRRVAVQILGAG